MDFSDFSGELSGSRGSDSTVSTPVTARGATKRRQPAAAAAAAGATGSPFGPPTHAPETSASTPCTIVVNVSALTDAQRELLQKLHTRLLAYPCVDGSVAPSAAALDVYAPLLQWMRANVYMHGSTYELDLRELLNIVRTSAFAAVTPFILAAACVELGIADAPSATWSACNMGRLQFWLVRATMWDLRSVRALRGYSWAADPDRRQFYEGIMEFARAANMAVCTHGHLTVLHIVREYYELQRADTSATRVRKTAWDVAVHMFSLVRNAVLLVQARCADALDGLSAPLRALPPTRTCVSKSFLASLTTAAPTEAVHVVHALELRTLAKPYAWLFACAHGLAEGTYELVFLRGRPLAWENAMVAWDTA